jgi:hypothetical protein
METRRKYDSRWLQVPATKISPVDQVVTPGVPGFSMCAAPFQMIPMDYRSVSVSYG